MNQCSTTTDPPQQHSYDGGSADVGLTAFLPAQDQSNGRKSFSYFSGFRRYSCSSLSFLLGPTFYSSTHGSLRRIQALRT